MYLRRVAVQGFRAAADTQVTCEFPGRFSLLIGPNGAGKTTINEAIYLGHTHKFPGLARPDATVLGAPPRSISIGYELEQDVANEGALGSVLRRRGNRAPTWTRTLERSLGQVRAAGLDSRADGLEQIRLIYLPALRNPVDQLARRESRMLLELLRAEQMRSPASGGLRKVRAQAEALLGSLTTQQLIQDVQGRIAETLSPLTGGAREHFAFIGTQRVDDAYVARVLELLLATMPNPLGAVRLEAASLGYVNLLHIAVTLAGVPDPSRSPAPTFPTRSNNDLPTGDVQPDDHDPDQARLRIEGANEAAEAEQDSFFPDVFHATVLIEEPEAHLHPQLQHGLIRYLRHVAAERPDLQVIVSTHASDLISACRPEELVVLRRDKSGAAVSRSVAHIPWSSKDGERIRRMVRLHLDASRSGALFAERVVLVEGITEAALVREIGRAWAAGDAAKGYFVEALSVVPVGNRIGSWPVEFLATPGHELVSQVAILSDTDQRPKAAGDPLPDPTPPAWQSNFTDDTTVRVFWSKPTLEPSLVTGNERLIQEALKAMKQGMLVTPTPENVDTHFRTGSGKKVKAEFALELAALMQERPDRVKVPPHLKKLFDWLYEGHALAGSVGSSLSGRDSEGSVTI